MGLRTGASVRRFQSAEMGAVTVIALASIVQGLLLYRLVPVLASLHASSGEAMSLPLRLSISLCNWSLILVPIVLVVWLGFQSAGHLLPSAIRRRALMVMATIAGPITIVALYFMAEESQMQAMRLYSAFASSAQVLERDLSTLSLASGDPDQVIASLGPKVSRDDFITDVRWGSPGLAFQLAEAYRAKGDMSAARRFYVRAQEAAIGFEEVLTPRLLNRQARWQAQFGEDYDFWLPNTSDMKKLPDRIRMVSQQRLDQLSR